jgi:DNA-binding MarR family transcriptional regulator
MKNIFYNEKLASIFIILRTATKPIYMRQLAKGSNYGREYMVVLLQRFEKLKLIKREIDGRRHYIFLTKKGKTVADNLIKLTDLLK